jgi:hypothetical protein
MDVQDPGGSQGSKLLLATPLNYSHYANLKAYPGTETQLDARAEVGGGGLSWAWALLCPACSLPLQLVPSDTLLLPAFAGGHGGLQRGCHLP